MKIFTKERDDLLISKLEAILQNTEVPIKDRIEEAKYECRQTKGKMSAGAYFALDSLKF